MTDLAKLKLVQAKLEYYDEILEISKDVYDGLYDYICQVYCHWIQEEQTRPQKRRNLVLLDEEENPVGYQSFLIQDDGRQVVAQALRIDGRLRGQGVGRKFNQLCRDYFLKNNPEVKLACQCNYCIKDCLILSESQARKSAFDWPLFTTLSFILCNRLLS